MRLVAEREQSGSGEGVAEATGSAAAGLPEAELERALQELAAGAADRDRDPEPPFPHEAISLLETVGVLAFSARATGIERPPAARELALVRSVARADASVGRILDGHLNGVERLAVQAPPAVRDAELAAVLAGALRIGVWGGDPRPGEGEPARLVASSASPTGEALRGVKTFCSGAGGVHRALVLARPPIADAEGHAPNRMPAPAGAKEARPTGPISVWVDTSDAERVEVDPGWYRSSGLRASVSHRVIFHDAPVLAHLGEPGSIAAAPWFARDALRTAASWAGMADAVAEAALEELAARPAGSELDALAAGRILTERSAIDAWLSTAARAMDASDPGLTGLAVEARAGIASAAHSLLRIAASATGSHPFATGGDLDRHRRDLQLFLLQHRLDPLLARHGAGELARRASASTSRG
jgi:hypothetical protein